MSELLKIKLYFSFISDMRSFNSTTRKHTKLMINEHYYLIAGDQLISSRISDDNFYNRRSDRYGEKIAKTVEKYSATRFICDNTKQKRVQMNIFMVPSEE